MTKVRLLNAQEVAVTVGISVPTLNSWYKWRKLEPEHKMAELLPDYVQEGGRQTRYWKDTDIWKLIKFRQELPKGRNGILGKVTQQYVKKTKED
jgi:predicted DNA-binding transcriptional regulator AlpA